jgi:hypothetical protein
MRFGKADLVPVWVSVSVAVRMFIGYLYGGGQSDNLQSGNHQPEILLFWFFVTLKGA